MLGPGTQRMAASSTAAEAAVNQVMAEEHMANIFADPAMEAAVRKGKMTMKSVLTEFAEWTAIPGPIQLVYALNTFTRVLWLIIWLGAFGIFVYEVYLIVAQYLAYAAPIRDSLQFEPKRFPVLTFCNQNPYKLTIVRASPSFVDIRSLMDDFQLMLQNGYANISNDRFGFNKARTPFQKDRLAHRALMLLAAQLPESTRRLAAYNFDEMVGSCLFNNVPCGRANFSSLLDPAFGACFQFNLPNQSNFYTLRPGNGGGLRLQLRAMQTDPASGAQLYLPTTTVAGFRLSVGMANVAPALDDTGISIGTGREVRFTMENTKTNLLKEPYGICRHGTEADVLDYYAAANYTYTIQSCLRSCRQNRAVQQCGCADPRFARPPNATFCSVQDVFCLLQLDSEAQTTEQFSPIRDCGCRPACHSQRVNLHTSQGTFPTPGHVPLAGAASNSQNFACQSGTSPSMFGGLVNANANPAGRCAQWNRQNVLVLNLWFDGLDFIQHDQTIDYTLFRASNDLGGQMGLWLGVCFISIFEVLTLWLMMCLFFAKGRKVRVVLTDAEKMREPRHRNVQELAKELDIHEQMDERIRRKIHQQRRERHDKRLQAEADLARAEQMAAEAEQRAHELVGLADSSSSRHDHGEGDARLRAEAANAVAVAHGARLRIQKLRELVALYSI